MTGKRGGGVRRASRSEDGVHQGAEDGSEHGQHDRAHAEEDAPHGAFEHVDAHGDGVEAVVDGVESFVGEPLGLADAFVEVGFGGELDEFVSEARGGCARSLFRDAGVEEGAFDDLLEVSGGHHWDPSFV